MFFTSADSKMSAQLSVGLAAPTAALHCVGPCGAAVCAATK